MISFNAYFFFRLESLKAVQMFKMYEIFEKIVGSPKTFLGSIYHWRYFGNCLKISSFRATALQMGMQMGRLKKHSLKYGCFRAQTKV